MREEERSTARPFNDRDYTYNAIIKQLGLLELHTRDGSAVEAGCHCIETKHLRLVEGLSEEGVSFAVSEKEKEFFRELGDLARSLRKNMEMETFNLRSALHDSGLNPGHRAYLPHGLTETEQENTRVRKLLSGCIRDVEKKEHCRPPYTDCRVNPVAVCRASIEG